LLDCFEPPFFPFFKNNPRARELFH
jgi:hypothetical protein